MLTLREGLGYVAGVTRKGSLAGIAVALVTIAGGGCGMNDPRLFDTRTYRLYLVPPLASGLPPQWWNGEVAVRGPVTMSSVVTLQGPDFAGTVSSESGNPDWSSAVVRAYRAGTSVLVGSAPVGPGNAYALSLDPSGSYDFMVFPSGGTHPAQVCPQGCAGVRGPTSAQNLVLSYGRDLYGDGTYPISYLDAKTNAVVPIAAEVDVYDWPSDGAPAGRKVTSFASKADGTYDVFLAPPTAEYRLWIRPDPSVRVPAQWGGFNAQGSLLSFTFNATQGDFVRIPLTALATGFPLRGTVLDLSQVAVPSTLSAFDPSTGFVTATTTSAADGSFVLDVLPGAYTLFLEPQDSSPLAPPLQVVRDVSMGTDGTTPFASPVVSRGNLLLLGLHGQDGTGMPSPVDLAVLSTEWGLARSVNVPAGGEGKVRVLSGRTRLLVGGVAAAAAPPAPSAGCPARSSLPPLYLPPQEIEGPTLGSDLEKNLLLKPGLPLSGRIRTPGGAPVGCVRVVVIPEALAAQVPGPLLDAYAGFAGLQPGASLAVSDDAGAFTVVLPPSSYSPEGVDFLASEANALP